MSKLSLITLHSVQNYGSALQTYASQVFFESLGCEVTVADYVRENNLRENIVDTGIKNSKFWNRNPLTRLCFRMLKERDLMVRFDKFDRFLRENIRLSQYRYLNNEDFAAHPICADIYCTGSDQTWNSYWNRGLLEPFFLTYAPEGKPKISYASSFGKKELDADEKPQIKKLLSDFKALTVREDEAVDILSDIGLHSERVLDPTLMLSRDEWRAFAAPRMIDGDYIVIYQLGHNKKFNELAKQIAKYKKIKLVRIGFGNEAYFYGGKVVKNPEVKEFLSLLANAKYIITDSFHATSFAINLNVDFFSFLPKVFSGRLTDILKLTGLSDRTFSDYETLRAASDRKIDFAPVNEIIKEERTRCTLVVKNIITSCVGEESRI